MQRKVLNMLSFQLFRRRERQGPSPRPAGAPESGGWNETPAEFCRSALQCPVPTPFALITQQTVFSKGEKTGSGKKNDMESHLLITVPGEWKTELPSRSNYSSVFSMKPNQASFQCLVDVSEAWIPCVLGSERKYLLTSWSFLMIMYYHSVPRKNLCHFFNVEGKS